MWIAELICLALANDLARLECSTLFPYPLCTKFDAKPDRLVVLRFFVDHALGETQCRPKQEYSSWSGKVRRRGISTADPLELRISRGHFDLDALMFQFSPLSLNESRAIRANSRRLSWREARRSYQKCQRLHFARGPNDEVR